MYLLVRDVGRAKGVLERSLEVVEILRGCEEIMEAGGRFAYFWKKKDPDIFILSIFFRSCVRPIQK